MKKYIYIILTLMPFMLHANNIKTIYARDYGILPNTKENLTPKVHKLLQKLNHSKLVKIEFEKGRYDFFAESCFDNSNTSTNVFMLEYKNNLIFDGQGSDFVFHGQATPFRLVHCTNIKIQNITIDWDRPYNSQGTIKGYTHNYIDIHFDKEKYPFQISSDTIYFLGEGWKKPIVPEYGNIYDSKSMDLAYQTRDNPLGRKFYSAKVTQNLDGTVRFHSAIDYKPAIGAQIVFHHARYLADGILILDSKDTELENITIYHTLSCGVHGYKSENIKLKKVDIITNKEKGRAFSTIADATHFNGCKGDIVFEDCEVSGAGDDYMNIHGMYANVQKVESDSSVIVAPNGRYIGFAPNERGWVLDTLTMEKKKIVYTKTQTPLFNDKGIVDGYRIVFKESIKGFIKVGDLLENIDKEANLYVRNCRMLKKNRGRSILVTTHGKVVIENNYFNTAGAAILIEGDIELWNESGAVRNVLIQNNIFENCYTSGDNIKDYPWGWGEAVISITPSVRPKNINSKAYHENIMIKNNTFKHFDYAVLYARSVKGLYFENNKLLRTYDYEPYYRPYNFFLDGCRNVNIVGNEISEDFLGKNLFMRNMHINDLRIVSNQKQEIKVDIE